MADEELKGCRLGAGMMGMGVAVEAEAEVAAAVLKDSFLLDASGSREGVMSPARGDAAAEEEDGMAR